MRLLKPLIPWQSLRNDYIATEIPVEHILLDEPLLTLVYMPESNQLGVRLAMSRGKTVVAKRNLRNITFRQVSLHGQRYVEVVTDSSPLFRAIYALVSDVADRLADGATDVFGAIEDSLADFELLLSRVREMSREEAIGLYGELLVLERLVAKGQPLDAWIGSSKEVHDFRLGTTELEVKTTVANTRSHIIHGLNQLTPSPDRQLHLVSVRIGSAGAAEGRSLDDLVAQLEATLGNDERAKRLLRTRLHEAGHEQGSEPCRVPYQVVGAPLAIAIDDEFPALGHRWLAESLGPAAAARIGQVQLTLNLEGLGKPFDETLWKS